MIRKAKPADIERLVELGVEALTVDAYDELVPSPDRILELSRECISSPAHFAWVSDVDGDVRGALVAYNSPMELYERNSANVLMWYCANGDGMKLMAEFIRWFRARPIIKQVQYTGERHGDPRILAILKKRYGFSSDVPFLYLMR